MRHGRPGFVPPWEAVFRLLISIRAYIQITAHTVKLGASAGLPRHDYGPRLRAIATRSETRVPPFDLVPGRLLKAPENFIDPQGVRTVFAEARHGRRDFIRKALASATATAAAVAAGPARAQSNPVPTEGGDPNILNLPADRKSTRLNSSHSTLSRMPSSA